MIKNKCIIHQKV